LKETGGEGESRFSGITCQKKVFAPGTGKWKVAAGYRLAKNLLNQKDIDLFAVATAMPEKIPSEKQCIYLVNLLKWLELAGLKPQDD
jgi:hypothetical protein